MKNLLYGTLILIACEFSPVSPLMKTRTEIDYSSEKMSVIIYNDSLVVDYYEDSLYCDNGKTAKHVRGIYATDPDTILEVWERVLVYWWHWKDKTCLGKDWVGLQHSGDTLFYTILQPAYQRTQYENNNDIEHTGYVLIGIVDTLTNYH